MVYLNDSACLITYFKIHIPACFCDMAIYNFWTYSCIICLNSTSSFMSCLSMLCANWRKPLALLKMHLNPICARVIKGCGSPRTTRGGWKSTARMPGSEEDDMQCLFCRLPLYFPPLFFFSPLPPPPDNNQRDQGRRRSVVAPLYFSSVVWWWWWAASL